MTANTKELMFVNMGDVKNGNIRQVSVYADPMDPASTQNAPALVLATGYQKVAEPRDILDVTPGAVITGAKNEHLVFLGQLTANEVTRGGETVKSQDLTFADLQKLAVQTYNP